MIKHIFWCKVCDAKKVDSFKPETGKFYAGFGSTWSVYKQEFTGDSERFGFAVCPDCKLEDCFTVLVTQD